MPIYEYRRPDGTTFDVMQKFSDEALTKDPETGVPVTKVLHAPAIHFKGKGFHNTDYGTKKRNRELEKAASDGADQHDQKMADKRKDEKKAEASSSASASPAESKPSKPSNTTTTSSSSASSSSSSSSSADKPKKKDAKKPKAA